MHRIRGDIPEALKARGADAGRTAPDRRRSGPPSVAVGGDDPGTPHTVERLLTHSPSHAVIAEPRETEHGRVGGPTARADPLFDVRLPHVTSLRLAGSVSAHLKRAQGRGSQMVDRCRTGRSRPRDHTTRAQAITQDQALLRRAGLTTGDRLFRRADAPWRAAGLDETAHDRGSGDQPASGVRASKQPELARSPDPTPPRSAYDGAARPQPSASPSVSSSHASSNARSFQELYRPLTPPCPATISHLSSTSFAPASRRRATHFAGST